MTALKRYQFRLPIDDERRIEDAAKKAGLAPNQLAKRIVQAALRQEPVSPERVAEDLMIVRAGVEQMFRRTGAIEELDKAVKTIRTRRSDDGHKAERRV